MTRLIGISTYVFFVFCAAILGLWVQDRTVPARQLAVPEYIPPVYAGGKLLIKFIVERERVCSSVRQDQLIDSLGVIWTSTPRISIVSPGAIHQRDVRITQTDVPVDFPYGPGKARVTISYVCNPFHNVWPIIDQLPDIDFVVIPPKAEG